MGEAWNLIAVRPMINILIVLSSYLFNNLGLSIIILTIIVNVCMLPLTKKQLGATKAMQELQPKLTELQKKYAKDKQKLAREQMRLYKESGISPTGCLVPMLIQMPIWIALFHSIMRVVAVIPENFLSLSQYLYSWPVVYSTLPLGNQFLWLNLATGDTFLALLVGGTMWVQQKMVTPTTTDPKQQAQSRMMLWMMPMMFAFLTLQFPGGLALFWVTSNIIRIVIQYFATGWGGLIKSPVAKQAARDKRYKRRIAMQEAPVADAEVAQEGETDYGESGDKQQDRGGGYPTSSRAIGRQPRRSRRHHPKRR